MPPCSHIHVCPLLCALSLLYSIRCLILPPAPHPRYSPSRSLGVSTPIYVYGRGWPATGQSSAPSPFGTGGCTATLSLWCERVALVTGQILPASSSVSRGWLGGNTADTGPTTGQVASVMLSLLLTFCRAGHCEASIALFLSSGIVGEEG